MTLWLLIALFVLGTFSLTVLIHNGIVFGLTAMFFAAFAIAGALLDVPAWYYLIFVAGSMFSFVILHEDPYNNISKLFASIIIALGFAIVYVPLVLQFGDHPEYGKYFDFKYALLVAGILYTIIPLLLYENVKVKREAVSRKRESNYARAEAIIDKYFEDFYQSHDQAIDILLENYEEKCKDTVEEVEEAVDEFFESNPDVNDELWKEYRKYIFEINPVNQQSDIDGTDEQRRVVKKIYRELAAMFVYCDRDVIKRAVEILKKKKWMARLLMWALEQRARRMRSRALLEAMYEREIEETLREIRY